MKVKGKREWPEGEKRESACQKDEEKERGEWEKERKRKGFSC